MSLNQSTPPNRSVTPPELAGDYEAPERRGTRATRIIAWITIGALVLLGGGATLIALLFN